MNAWESRVVLGGMAVAMALALAGCGRQAEHPTSAPPKVTVTEPEQRAVLEYEELPGRVAAIDHVVVKARVTGYLNKVHFQEGGEDREGDLLYTIDPGSTRLSLRQRRPPYSSRRLRRLRHIPIISVRCS